MNQKLKELSESGVVVKIEVTPENFKAFACYLMEHKEEIPAKIEKLYTRQEVQQIFSVDLSTLYRWNISSYLCSVKIGGKVRYRQSDVLRVINGEDAGIN